MLKKRAGKSMYPIGHESMRAETESFASYWCIPNTQYRYT